MIKRAYAALAAMICLLFATGSYADQPRPWETGMQQAATGNMHQIRWFEAYTLWFIIPITLLVLILLLVVMVKFRASKNPVPSKTSHNTLIEVIWTLGPVIVLLFLAVPSFQLLTRQLAPTEEPELTIKATGYQWNWGYEHQVGESPLAIFSILQGSGTSPLAFDSFMLKEPDRAAAGKEDKSKYPRLLAVDNEMVVPVGKNVRVLVTAAPTDVIHSFAMPAFGVRIDAIPGRLNETWFNADREGLYYGQCSELCGKDHSFMPIAIRVVSDDQYKQWLAAAATDLNKANKALMAAVDQPTTVKVAENTAK